MKKIKPNQSTNLLENPSCLFKKEFYTRKLLNYLSVFLLLFGTHSVSLAQCPTVFIDDMYGVPGYAQIDEASVCGVPDTLTIYLLNSSGQDLLNSEFTLHVPPGLQFSGDFSFTDPAYPVLPGNWNDLQNPSFVIPTFGADSVQFIQFGIIATCEVYDLDPSETMEFEATFDFIANAPQGGLVSCSAVLDGETDYRLFVTTPTLNLLSISPVNASITGNERCVNVTVSQNGINASLTNFDFEIFGLHLAPDFAISSLTVAGNALPYTYDAITQTLTAHVDDTLIPNGALGEDEMVVIQVCYQELLGCETTNDAFDLTYAVSFGCGSDGPCTDPSILNGTLAFRPSYAAIPTIDVTTVQLPAICGNNAIFDVVVGGSNTDPFLGVMNNLEVALRICDSDAFEATDVTINGASLPAGSFYYDGVFFTINTSMLLADPDGMTGMGLDDTDGDGEFDDLPGGQTLTMQVVAAIKCQDPASIAGCASIDCTFNNARIRGERHCGTPFDISRTIANPEVFSYGSVSSDFVGEAPIGITALTGYDFGLGSTGTNTIPVQFCYEFGTDGVGACSNGQTYFEFQVTGTPRVISDMEINTASVTYDGNTVAPGDIQTIWENPPINFSKVFRINAGSNAAGQLCYNFTMELDSCVCYPVQYVTGSARVVEECFDCVPDACTIVRACDNTTLASRRNCGCDCELARTVVEARRTEYGFSDPAMTIPLDETTVPSADLARFLPTDTAYLHLEVEVLDQVAINEADEMYMYAWIRGAAGWSYSPGMAISPKFSGAMIEELSFEKVGNPGVRVPIDFTGMDCISGGATRLFNTHSGYPGTNHFYALSAAAAAVAGPGFHWNSGADVLEDNRMILYIYNADEIRENGGPNRSGNCYDYVVQDQMGGAEDGDKFHIILKVPMQVNPYKIENPVIATRPDDPMIIGGTITTFQTVGGVRSVFAGSCGSEYPIEGYAPKPLDVETTYNIGDCTASVEHIIRTTENVPNGWYANEYRPFYTIENLNVPLVSPLVYVGNPEQESNTGVITSMNDPTFDNNTNCVFYSGQDYCVSAGANTGYGNFPASSFPEQLALGVPTGPNDEVKVRYDLGKLCPGEISYPTDYELILETSYKTPYDPGGNFCNLTIAQATGLYAFFGDASGNPYPVPTCPGDVSQSTLMFHLDDYHADTTYHSNPILNDASQTLPLLTSTVSMAIITDNPAGSEMVTYEVCAGAGSVTHANVVTSVSVPLTINLEDFTTTTGTSLTYIQTGQTATHNIYSVTTPDLAPNTCYSFIVETELLFCPTPEIDAKVCINSASSCLPAELASQLLEGGGDACTSTGKCFEYEAGTVELQNDWVLPPVGDTYALCEEVQFEMIIKNTRTATLNNLIFEIAMPAGLTIVGGSFEYAYPGGGGTTQGPWLPLNNPSPNGSIIFGDVFTLYDSNIVPVNSSGLPGVGAGGNLNQLSIRFKAITSCDEYVSNSPVYIRTTADDPCGNETSAPWAQNTGVTVNNAVPLDFAQFLIVADPINYSCGGTVPVNITGLNLSTTGAESDNAIACFTFPSDIAYVPGSFSFNSPSGYTPTNVTETNLTAGAIELCFDIPDGIAPQQFFAIGVELTPSANIECGEVPYEALVTSPVEGQTCVADNSTCTVYVNNTINQHSVLNFRSGVEIAEVEMVVLCDEDPLSATYEYDISLDASSDYIGNVDIEFYRDLDGNGQIDSYDTQVHMASYFVNVTAGTPEVVSGMTTVAEIESCPLLINATFDYACSCNSNSILWEGPATPEFLANLSSPLVLCPGEELILDVCGGYEFEYVSPASLNPVVLNGCESVDVCPDNLSNVSLDFGSASGMFDFTDIADGSGDITNHATSGANLTNNKSFDVFNVAAGMLGQDGTNDVFFEFTQVPDVDLYGGTVLDPLNGVTVDISQTGIGVRGYMRHNSSGSTESSTGDVSCYEIKVSFSPNIYVEAQDFTALVNSVNTNGEAYESMSLVFLNAAGMPYGTATYSGFYTSPPTGVPGGANPPTQASSRWTTSGTGVYLADDNSVIDVTTDIFNPFGTSNQPPNTYDPNAMTDGGLNATDQVTGAVYTVCLEDVAASTNDGDETTTVTSFQSWLNGFDLASVGLCTAPPTFPLPEPECTITLGNYPSSPVQLKVTSDQGLCAGEWILDIEQLDAFEIGPYTQVDACDMECNMLDLNLPDSWDGNVTISWSPTTYLDDPTSATPMICNPAADIVYTVTVSNNNGGCAAVADFPVNVINVNVPMVNYVGYDDCYLPYDPAYIEVTPGGYDNYEFYYTLNGVDILVQTGPSNQYFIPSGVGTYYVVANDGFCNVTTDLISVNIQTCIFDLALTKGLADGQQTPFYAGDIVNFDIWVFNQGTLSASDIIITDYIPAGMQLADPSWTDIGGGMATQTIVGPLTAGDSIAISIMLEVLPTATAGNLTNTAEISSADDENGENYPDADSEADSDPTNDGTPTDDATDNENGDEDDSDPSDFPIAVFDLAMTKSLAPGQPAPVTVGDDITYEIEICNQGSVAAQNISIVDYLPAEVTLNDPNWQSDASGNAFVTIAGPIPPAGIVPQCIQVPITVTLNAFPAGGSLQNFAELTGAEDENGNPQDDIDSDADDDPTNDGPVTDDETENANGDEDDHDGEEIAVVIHDLELEKTISSMQTMPVSPGDDITFTLTVTNNGTVDEFNIGIVDNISAGLLLNDTDWIENTPGAAELVNLIAGPLAPNTSTSVDITFTIDPMYAGESLTNTAEISEFDDDMDPDNDPPEDIDSDPDNDDPTEDDQDDETFPVEQIFDLSLTKMLTPGQDPPFSIGDLVSHTFEVCNQGTIAAYNVEVVDYIPSDMMLADADWTPGIDPTQAFFSIPGPILPDECATVEITTQIVSLTVDSDLTNSGEIVSAEDVNGDPQEDVDSTYDNDPDNDGDSVDDETDNEFGDEDDSDPAPTPFVIHDLELAKTISDNQTFPVNPGDDITFTFTVYNQGTVDEFNIGIADNFPADLVLNDASWTENPTGTATLVSLIPGPLAPGDSSSVDITFTVDPNFQGSSLANSGEINEFDDDMDPNNDPPEDNDSDPDNDDPSEDDQDDESFPVEQVFDLALTKMLAPNQPTTLTIGDDVTYVIEVCNQGTIDAYNVNVIDYIPAGMSLNDSDWTLGSDGNGYHTLAGPITPMTCASVDVTMTINFANTAEDLRNYSEITSAEDENGDPQDDADGTFDDDPDNDGPATDDETDGANGDEDNSDYADPPFVIHDLELNKSLSINQTLPVAPGDDITFTFTVYNQGTVPEFNIGIADNFPADLILNDAAWSENPTGTATLVTLIPGPLAPGDSTSVDITFTIDPDFQGSSLANSGEINEFDDDMDPNNPPPEDSDSDPDNNDPNEDDQDEETFPVEQTFDLSLTKMLAPNQPTTLTIGDDVTYVIEVCNQGTIDAYNVNVVDYIPAGMSLNDSDWTLGSDGNGYHTLAGPITPMTCASVDVTMTINFANTAEDLRNYSEITSAEDENGDPQDDADGTFDDDPDNDGPATDDQTDGANGDEDNSDYADPPFVIHDLELNKSLSINQTLPVAPGDDITFTFTVYNQGTVDEFNIGIADNFPADLILNDATWTENPTGTATLVTLIPGPLAPGDSTSVDITFTIDPDFQGSSLANSGEINEFDDDMDPNNPPPVDSDSDPDNDDPNEDDQDEETFPVEQRFDLSMTKMLSAMQTTPVTIGDDVTYTFEVCNQGTIDAYNVEVVDNIPPGMVLNDTDWTPSSNPTQANNTIPGPITPMTCASVDVTMTIVFANSVDDLRNSGEITGAEDENGDPQTDDDSNYDDDPDNDGPMTDNETDGGFGDEDDSDYEDPPFVLHDLELAKNVSDSQTFPVGPGDDITFTFTVYNQGTVPEFSIGIADNFPIDLILNDANWTENPTGTATLVTLIPGPLAPGDSTTMDITFTIDPDFQGSSLANSGEISEFDDDMDPNNPPPDDHDSDPDNDDPSEDDQDEETFPVDQYFDLSMTKMVAASTPATVTIGDDVTYVVEVCNQGTIDAYNVNVVDYIPAGMILNDPDWTLGTDGNAYYTMDGPIEPEACVRVDVTMTIVFANSIDDLRNSSEIASAEDENGDPQSDEDGTFDNDPDNDGPATDDETDGANGDEDNSDYADPPFVIHDLELAKNVSSSQTFPVGPGDDITFTFTIYNQGTVPEYNIGIADNFPPELSVNDANWTENPVGTATLVSLIPGPLDAGDSLTVDITFTIDPNFQGGSLANSAEISEFDDDNDPNNDPPEDQDSDPDNDDPNEDDQDEETFPVEQSFDLSLTKMLANSQPVPVTIGDDVTYTLNVCNQGTIDAYNVEVVDYIPAGMVLNDPDWTIGSNGNAYYTIAGPIVPMSCLRVDVTMTIIAPDDLRNSSEITSAEDEDGNPQQDEDGDFDDDPDNDGPMTDNETDGNYGDEDNSDYEDPPFVLHDLELGKAVSSTQVFPVGPGDDVTYTLTVANQGTVPEFSIGIIDLFPPSLILNDPAWTETSPGVAELVNLIPGPLDPNTTVSVDITFTISPTFMDTTIANTAEISEFDNDTDPNNDGPEDWDSETDNGDPNEDDQDDNTISVGQFFDLTLKKTLAAMQPTPINVGDDVVFTIEVCNEGTIDAYNVEVVDYIPTTASLNDANWTLSSAGYAYTTIAGPIATGTCATVDITVTVDSLPAGGNFRNFAELTSAEDAGGNPQTDIDGEYDDDPTNDGNIHDDETGGNYGDQDDSDISDIPVGCDGPVASINAVNVTCIGGTIQLATNDLADSYLWTGPNGFMSTQQVPALIDPVTIQDAGTYSLQITIAGCVSPAATYEVEVSEGPEKPTIACTTCPVCDGDDIILVTSTNGSIFEWVGPLGASAGTLQIPGLTTTVPTTTIDPSHPSYLPGDWQVVVYDQYGCASEISDPVDVIVNPIPDTPIPFGDAVCEGEDAQLTTAAVAGATYNWFDGTSTIAGNLVSNDQNPVISNLTAAGSPHYYWLSVTIDGCESPMAQTTITIFDSPTVAASNNGTECVDPLADIGLFAVASGGTPPYLYSWTGPNGFVSIDVDPVLPNAMNNMSGTYIVSIVDANGCTATGSTILDITIKPDLPVISSTAPVCVGDGITISIQNYSGNTITYDWTGPNGPYPSTNELLINPTELADIGTYTVVVTVDSCVSDVSEPYEVELWDVPMDPTPSYNGTLCEYDDLMLMTNPPATGGPFTYLWTGPNGFTSTLENPTVPSIDVNDAGSYLVEITNSNGCTARTSVEVVINPQPVTPQLVASALVLCDTEDLILSTDPYKGVSVIYTWTAPDGTTTTTAVSSTTYPAPVMSGDYSVIVSVEGCSSLLSAPVTITVNPTSAAPILDPTFTACEGGSIQLTTPTMADEYMWTGPNGFMSTLQNPAAISPATLNDAGTYTLVVTNNDCPSPASTTEVIVNPTPATPAIVISSPICEGDDLVLSTSGTCDSFVWIGPDGNSVSTLNNPLLVTTTPSTAIPAGDDAYDAGMWYVICVDAEGCESAPSAPLEAIINPIPAAPTATNNTPICEGETLNLFATAIPGATYSWTGPNGFTSTNQNPEIVGATTGINGDYMVTATVNGCTSAIATTVVDVQIIPEITGLTGGGVYCEGAALTLSLDAVPGATYTWIGPNGLYLTGQQTPTLVIDPLTANDEGAYTVEIVTGSNCISLAASTYVEVESQPATPTIANNGPLCEGDDLILTTSIYNGNGVAVDYVWTLPDGSNTTTSTPELAITATTTLDAGSYSVVIDHNGCSSLSSTNSVVVVNAIPSAPMVLADLTSVCEGGVLNVFTTTQADSYLWTGPNGFTSTLASPAVVDPASLSDAGTYTLVVTTNGCSSPASSIVIDVTAAPAAPTMSSNSPICEDEDLVLTTSSICANYLWIGPGGSSQGTLTNPLLTTSTSTTTIPPADIAYEGGMWSVICVDANGCESPASPEIEVIINEIPDAVIPLNNSPLCEGAILELTAPTITGATYEWVGPNGYSSVQQNPTVSGVGLSDAGDYQVYVTVNGCTSVLSQATTVVVNENPVAVNLTGSGSYCEGESVTLSVDVVPGATYTWSGPNGFYITNMPTPDVVFNPVSLNDAGTYSVTITSSEGCNSKPASLIIAIKPKPATPVVANNGPLCEGMDLILTTTANTGALTSYQWSTPNGNFTTSVPQFEVFGVTTADAGAYTVVTVVDGCSSLMSPASFVQITAQPLPPANITSNSPVCEADDIYLNSDFVTGATYTWTGPGGYTSTAQNPIIGNASSATAGEYFVNVTINGCVSANSDTVTVVVNPIPTPSIASNNGPNCEGGMIELSANGSATATYTWYNSATGLAVGTGNPLAINNLTTGDAGDYYVEVTENNCTSAASNTTTIVVNPVPSDNAFAGLDQTLCQVTTAFLDATVPSQGTGYWTQLSGVPSTIITPIDAGSEVVGLVIGNTYEYVWTLSNGTCPDYSMDTVSISITDQLPQPAMPQSNSPICEGEAIYLTAQYVAGATYTWIGPGGFVSSIQNPIVGNTTQLDAGEYFLNITVNGCTSPNSDTIDIVINPLPTAGVASNDSPACVGGDVTLSSTGPSAATYTWYSEATGQAVGVGNPLTLTGLNLSDTGDYYVEVTENGCTSIPSNYTDVMIQPVPTDNSYAGLDQEICQSSTTFLNATTPTNGSGFWTQVLGPPTIIITPIDPATEVVGMVEGNSYTYVWTLSNGPCLNFSTDTVTIDVTAPLLQPATPTSNAPLSTNVICAGDAITLNGESILDATYTWHGPNGWTSNVESPIIANADPLMSGEYYYEVTVNGCNSPLSATVLVTVIDEVAAPVISSNSPVCIGSDILLEAEGNPNLIYEWFSLSTGNSIGFGNPLTIPNASTLDIDTYYAIASFGDCTSPASDYESIDVSEGNTTDNAYAGLDQYFCGGESVVSLNASEPLFAEGIWTQIAGPATTVVSSTNPESLVFEMAEVGEYLFEWSLSNGVCDTYSRDTILIVKEPVPEADTDYYTVEYNGVISRGDYLDNDFYEQGWDINLLIEPTVGEVRFNNDGTFKFDAPNYVGVDSFYYEICNPNCPDLCAPAWVYIEIGLEQANDCVVPNIFTPNGDGVNDALVIHCLVNFPNNKIRVYNRWGDLVYNDGPYNNDWAGTYKDENLPEGTYFYVIELEPDTNPSNILQGFVTVQR